MIQEQVTTSNSVGLKMIFLNQNNKPRLKIDLIYIVSFQGFITNPRKLTRSKLESF